jgi:hypothetical protein
MNGNAMKGKRIEEASDKTSLLEPKRQQQQLRRQRQDQLNHAFSLSRILLVSKHSTDNNASHCTSFDQFSDSLTTDFSYSSFWWN